MSHSSLREKLLSKPAVNAAYNELDYEIEGIGYSARNIGISRSWNIYDCLYSYNCFSCDSCFGCVALNKNKYC